MRFITGTGNTSQTAPTGTLSVTGTNVNASVTLTGARLGIAVLDFTSNLARDFGTVWVGSASGRDESFTVTNVGGVTSTALLPSFTGGDVTQFTITSLGTCTAGITLAPNAFCTYLVRFNPTSVGNTKATNFRVQLAGNGSANDTQNVGLTGRAVASTGLIASPTPQYFGSVAAGASSAATTTQVSNPQTGVASGVPVVTVSGSFTVGANTCTAILNAGGTGSSCSVDVTFTPAGNAVAGTLLTGTLSIDGGAAGIATVALSGTVLQPAKITADNATNPIDFDEVLVDSTSATTLITVRNVGEVATPAAASVAITGADASQFLLQNNTCTAVLPAAGSCTFGLALKPTTSNTKVGTVTISAGIGGGDVTFGLTGIGRNPTSLSITPDMHNFAAGAVGSAVGATDFDYTVKNLVGAVATSNLVITTSNPSFTIVTNTCPVNLPGGATCTVTVRLTPQVVGTYIGATVNVVGANGATAITAATLGSGVSALTTPTAGTFGTVTVGNKGDISFTITNDATSPATGTLSTLLNDGGGNFAIKSDGCAGVTLASGGTCTIVGRFAPTSAGAKTGSIVVTWPGSASSVTMDLTGTGN